MGSNMARADKSETVWAVDRAGGVDTRHALSRKAATERAIKELAAMDAVRAKGAVPRACGPEIPEAPARGPVQILRPVAQQVNDAGRIRKTGGVHKGSITKVDTGYKGRAVMRRLDAFFVRKATRGHLVAEVLRKDAQRGRHYLETQQTGGKRGLTGLERLFKDRLKYDGLIVSVLPTKALRKNKYGNVAKLRMQQIISGVQAQGEATQNTSAASRKRSKGKRAEYFVPKADSKLSAGVYERKGYKIAKVLAFSDKAPTYRKRFPMEKHAERVATDAASIATERAFN